MRVTVFLVLCCSTLEAQWRAGVAGVDITPDEPMWLSGYASRTSPHTSVLSRIHVKALALEDPAGERLLAITSDLLTMPRTLAEPVARRLAARFAMPRARVLLCASHSHSTPVIEDRLVVMYFLDETRRAQVKRYTRQVEEALVDAGSRALESLEEAAVFAGSGEVGFAINRRRRNPADSIDHEVPVLRVDFLQRRDGEPHPRRAVFFAYACHNTVLSGPDLCGDYAGFAQQELEKLCPGTTALFASGCAGDQNPDPRRKISLAKKYGADLANAVKSVMDADMVPVRGFTTAAFGHTSLQLSPAPSRDKIEEDAGSKDRYIRARAERLIARIDAGGKIEETYPYAAQVWGLGETRIVVALAGEVVVDYALRLKREVPRIDWRPTSVMTIAYANDVPAYIPTEKVLREGGYEGESSMRYYDFHGPWAPGIEATILSHVHDLVRRAKRGSARARGSRLEKIWGEGAFTEGPVFGTDGALYFSDIPNDRVLRIESGNVTRHRAPSGKANGLLFDHQGRLVACEGAAGGGRRVSRLERDGTVTILAERVGGKRLNSPNDLTIDRQGRIYFSDPRYGGGEPRELERESVYRIDAPGEVTAVVEDVQRPNGLAISPDGKTLWVSDAGARKLRAYRIDASGPPTRGRLVFDFGAGRGIDGMEVDVDGNIWAAAGSGPLSGVWVISPDGVLVDFVATPETATNCCFGEDGRTLFITAGRSVYTVRTAISGHRARPVR